MTQNQRFLVLNLTSQRTVLNKNQDFDTLSIRSTHCTALYQHIQSGAVQFHQMKLFETVLLVSPLLNAADCSSKVKRTTVLKCKLFFFIPRPHLYPHSLATSVVYTLCQIPTPGTAAVLLILPLVRYRREKATDSTPILSHHPHSFLLPFHLLYYILPSPFHP